MRSCGVCLPLTGFILCNTLQVHPYCHKWPDFIIFMANISVCISVSLLLCPQTFLFCVCWRSHTMQQGAWLCLCLFSLVFSPSSDEYPELELLYQGVALVLIFEEPPYCFHSSCTSLYSHQHYTGLFFSTSSPALFTSCLFDAHCSNMCELIGTAW